MMLGERRELNQLGCNYFAPSFDLLENHQESESEGWNYFAPSFDFTDSENHSRK